VGIQFTREGIMLVAMLLLVAPGDTAQAITFESRTCTFWGETQYCSSLDASVSDGMLWGNFQPPTLDQLHATAFALFALGWQSPPLQQLTGLSGWGGAIPFTAPESYGLFAGMAAGQEDRWYITGEGFSGDTNGWISPGQLPRGLMWAWRAESEDGGTVLDCFEGEACGGFSAARFATTVTPEPATWTMLLGGLLLLALARYRRAGYCSRVGQPFTEST
jgi:hypothetical protein